MTTRPLPFARALPLAAALALAACSQTSETQTDAAIAAQESAAATTGDRAMTPEAAASQAAATGTTVPKATPSPGRTLALEGLGDVVIGQSAPSGSSFAERGAQANEDCRTISSPSFPGVYAITKGKGGPVRRITVGERSDVKLVEGVGIGATAQEVLAAFPGFRSTPHKYVEAPGKYLTQPGNDPRLRFEIGTNGRVSAIHVGIMPELGYVEGCS